MRTSTQLEVESEPPSKGATKTADSISDGNDAPTEPVSETLPAGQRRLGRYELLYELASGGMATVYLARAAGAVGFEKLVALKRIHPHLAKESRFVEMFLDEARIASRISHPNVCSVFDFGQAGSTYYLAMEYLLGETVSRIQRKLGKHPEMRPEAFPALAARIIADACEGLHAAHELRDETGASLDVVHRDVSPQNIFVTYDGSVRIVDFGIARASQGRLHTTTTGTVKGKYAYMSPEQVRSLPLDRRTDIWALGVVLWELLTMKRLFRQENEVDTILAVTTMPILPPSRARSDLPPDFDPIVMRALARDPDDRYATARELGRDLSRAAAAIGAPVTLADLAEWMERFFPEEHARRRELLDLARQSGGVPKISPSIFGKDSSDSQSISIEVPTMSETPKSSARAPRVLAAAGGGLLVAAAIGLAWMGWGGGAASDEAEDTEQRLVPLADTPDASADAGGVRDAGRRPMLDASVWRTDAGRDGGARRPISPPAQPLGHINVVTPGYWADVYLGRRRLGRTPLQARIPSGRQTLRILPNGEEPARVIGIRVAPGDEVTPVVVQRQP